MKREKARPVRLVGPQEYIDQFGVRHFTHFNDMIGRIADFLDEQVELGKVKPGGTFIFKNPLRPVPPAK